MFRKIVLTVLVLGLMVGVGYACTGNDCKTTGNVMTSNDGNKGYIFTYDCNQGQTNVGKWVDPSTIPALKGDKGDKGDTGATGETGKQGIQGVKGDTGATGTQGVAGKDGLNGTNGTNGVDGKDGLNGIDGAKGDTGSQGEQGIQGEQGVKGDVGLTGETGQQGNTGDTGSKGDTGDKGDEGKEGKQGKQGIQGERGKGLEDRVEVIGEVRLLDTKRTTWSIYAGRDFNNNVNIVGAKVTVKIGRSYYEKKIDALEAKVNSMVPEQVTETITKDKDGNVVSIHMSNNDKGASFSHSF